MLTKQVIQASANIIRITSLAKGNVYKRVNDSSYGATITYGIVIDLMNDGEHCYIEAYEYEKNYGDIKGKVVILSEKSECAIFPATPEDVKEYLQESLDGMLRSINDAEKEIAKKKESYKKAEFFVTGEQAKQLSATSFEVIPTSIDKETVNLIS